MLFNKDITQMTDTELTAAVKNLIESCEPESVRLDYKEKLNINTESEKKELAKDTSSFANEQGGCLLYGVPQTRDADLPRPKPLQECGMELDPGLQERIENILMSAIQPPLHALTIKTIDIEDIRPKQLLLVYHPESYWKPHMFESYGEHRYYRRGNFQCIKMTERQVEAAYQAREASRRHATEFFEAASFGPGLGVLRAVACPVIPGRFKDKMLQPGFRDWLTANPPMGPNCRRAGDWLPFLHGWRFLGGPDGSISGKQYEIRVFHNGAVCLSLDPYRKCISSGSLLLEQVARDLRNLFIGYSATVFRELSLACPVVVRFCLSAARGLKAAANTEEHAQRLSIQSQLAESEEALVGRTVYMDVPEEHGLPYTDGEDIVFDEETSTDEIAECPDAFIGRLMTRIGTAFGLLELSDGE